MTCDVKINLKNYLICVVQRFILVSLVRTDYWSGFFAYTKCSLKQIFITSSPSVKQFAKKCLISFYLAKRGNSYLKSRATSLTRFLLANDVFSLHHHTFHLLSAFILPFFNDVIKWKILIEYFLEICRMDITDSYY